MVLMAVGVRRPCGTGPLRYPVRHRTLRYTNASLLFDGQRIVDNQTAEDLEMEDGDVIEVLLERE